MNDKAFWITLTLIVSVAGCTAVVAREPAQVRYYTCKGSSNG